MVKLKLIIAAFLFPLLLITAQSVSVSATTDTAIYKVGDFIKYKIEVVHDKGVVIYLPSVKDSVKTLEYIDKLPSEKNEANNKIIERYTFIFSKYDSASVTIPSISIAYTQNNSQVKKYIPTNQLTITVRTLPVNRQEDIMDVKEPVKLPLNWLLIGAVILALLILSIAVYYLYSYYKKRKAVKGIVVPEVFVPPHERALAGLTELEQKKLWQNGFVKEYHSRVTEIVRQYFEERFNFRALEMTSSEILAVLSFIADGKIISEISERFFGNADLVKFAKFEPMPKVNDEMMKQAFEIIRNTIPAAENQVENGEKNVQ